MIVRINPLINDGLPLLLDKRHGGFSFAVRQEEIIQHFAANWQPLFERAGLHQCTAPAVELHKQRG